MHGQTKPLGQMHVNKLRDIKPFPMKKYILRNLGDEPPFPDDID